ncbi:MAG: class I SAM-dependent methyltransferase [Candidatus Thorarchaeota archaeon]
MENGLKPKTWGCFWDIFGEKLVEQLDIQDGVKVLDVGTGGGSVLYPICSRIGQKGHVTGIDIKEKSIESMNSEIERCRINNARVVLMNASEMTFEDESFDFITSGFIGWGSRFDFHTCKYREPDAVMSELFRVLKTGGTIGISTWITQEDLDFMKQILTSQSIPCRKNYSAETEEGWRVIMSNTRFRESLFLHMPVYYAYESVDVWWKEMNDYNWASEGEDNVLTDAVKKHAVKMVQNHLTAEGGVQFQREALFVIGTK